MPIRFYDQPRPASDGRGRCHGSAVSPRSSTGTTHVARSDAGLTNTGRSVFRQGNADDGRRCVIRWRSNAVNLWTVGCADARETAHARSRRLSTSFNNAPTAARIEFDSGKGATFNRLPQTMPVRMPWIRIHELRQDSPIWTRPWVLSTSHTPCRGDWTRGRPTAHALGCGMPRLLRTQVSWECAAAG
jgi:hypothetical protein